MLEVLDQIDRYLIGASTDRDLEAWVMANLQRILDSGDSAAIDIVNEVDGGFVELRERIIDRTALHERLAALVRIQQTVDLRFGEPTPLAVDEISSLSDTINLRMEEAFNSVRDLQVTHSFA